MSGMHIFEIALLVAVIFFVGRSFYIESHHKKKGPYIKIGVYSGAAIFNVMLVLFILVAGMISIKNSGGTLLDVSSIYILIPILFIIYQTVLSLRFTFCQDGVCYLGQFYSYKQLKTVQIVPVKDKFNVIIFTNKATLSFKVNKNNKFLVEEAFKKYRIKITKL
ncbi:hypothetical protein [Clostridium sp.]|uniref:hypothetical protein n=1 Tax=Clostridium sp. TaxID=1506 RepID=UPI002FC58DC4